jgi:hypothetical protein
MVSEALLWQFLEEHPKQNAPWCEWQDAFGGWDSFTGFERKFLQLTSQRAFAVNCRTDCGLGCPRKVVEHAADDIVAVCPEQEEKPYSLNKKDVLVYTLNRSAFHKSICSGLGITLNENGLDGIPGVCRVGDFIPTAGYSFPIHLTFKDNPEELLESVRNITLLGQGPFTLFIPTRKQLTPRVEDQLQKSGSICLVLSEEFSIQGNGSLKAVRSATDVFAAFQAEVPEPDSGGMVHFDTPAGISWNGITIKFVDGHTVSIHTTKSHGRYNYTQMGMANTRNGNPTIPWELLRAFAESRGQIDWQSQHASFKVKDQKPRLSKKLREFFRLKEDPIEYLKEEGCYRCLFTIKPEGDDDSTYINEDSFYE